MSDKQSTKNKKPKIVLVAYRTDPPVMGKDKYGHTVTESSGGMTVTFNSFKTPEMLDKYDIYIVGVDPKHTPSMEESVINKAVDEKTGIKHLTVGITKDLADKSYGYVNNGQWWFAHNMAHLSSPVEGGSEAYQKVDEILANTVLSSIDLDENDQVICHDNLVSAVPTHLKKIGCKAEVSFFLHTPLATKANLENAHKMGLCNYEQIKADFITPLLADCDKVAFQTQRDAAALADYGVTPIDKKLFTPYVLHNVNSYVSNRLHTVPITVAPVAPNADDVKNTAKLFKNHPIVGEFIKAYAHKGKKLFILSGRVDPIKNHDGVFDGVEKILDEHPEQLANTEFAIIGPKTRSGLKVYDEHYDNVLKQVERINNKYVEKGLKKPGEEAVRYWGNMHREVLLGVYGAADEIAAAGGQVINVVYSRMDGHGLTADEGSIASKHVLLMASNNIGAINSLGAENAIVGYHTNAGDALKDTRIHETAENILAAQNMTSETVVLMNERSMDKLAQFSASNWAEALSTPVKKQNGIKEHELNL